MAPTLLKFEELSSYEQIRTPHDVVDANIMVNADAVKSEFTCIICLEILKKTMTSQRCLHRFCYDCITTSLRLGNKECPTCRAKLTSKRDLRADSIFDALIAALFPQTKNDDVKDHQGNQVEENTSQKTANKQKQLKSHKNTDPEENIETGRNVAERKKSHRKTGKTMNEADTNKKSNIKQRSIPIEENDKVENKQNNKTNNSKKGTLQHNQNTQIVTRSSRKLEDQTKANKNEQNKTEISTETSNSKTLKESRVSDKNQKQSKSKSSHKKKVKKERRSRN